MNNDPPVGCQIVIGIVLIGAALFFTFAEVARGVVWIKWMFQ